jgi:hypothetical protein
MRELCHLPLLGRHVSALNDLDAEEDLAILFQDSGVVGVGDGTGLATTYSCNVVLVAAQGGAWSSFKE